MLRKDAMNDQEQIQPFEFEPERFFDPLSMQCVAEDLSDDSQPLPIRRSPITVTVNGSGRVGKGASSTDHYGHDQE